MTRRISEIRRFSEAVVRSIEPTVAVCKQHLGISTFGYRRFLSDGKSFGFSNNVHWNQVFLQYFTNTPIPEYERDFRKFIVSGENYLIRQGVPPKGNRFLEALYETDVWNTLVVYVRTPGSFSIEAFFLGATRNNVYMAEIYTKKREFIEYLIKLLQVQLAECFTQKTDAYFSNTLSDPSCLKDLKNFLSLERHRQLFKNALMSLSKREKEITCLLIRGYRRKDIASRLNIAPKTVDANIEHIKNKTHTVSKVQFLKLLQDPTTEEALKHDGPIPF